MGDYRQLLYKLRCFLAKRNFCIFILLNPYLRNIVWLRYNEYYNIYPPKLPKHFSVHFLTELLQKAIIKYLLFLYWYNLKNPTPKLRLS